MPSLGGAGGLDGQRAGTLDAPVKVDRVDRSLFRTG